MMRRVYSSFPSGLPGIGLLVLRLALGTVGAIESGLLLKHDGRLLTDAAGMVSGAAAVLLVTGLMTPVAVVLLALNTAALWLAGDTAASRVDHSMALLRVGSSVAAVLLGPGAYSADARLFGRREVVIDLEPPSRSQRPSS
jgi:uncharacterized membrane protein YphA (DoxX/SURF4 family)